ncbi:uncharacterized protein LOC130998378 [Salvia miltiorrhiza]|uniref:uncharacterized protein LOC130998378 n=1 Tax=Salvia miltiorrhiza TaxID=226208 RepID=UPI0025AB9558|nr:uncharacterized protein LOC130998378 [Salvia miltiorrhiza]
MCLKAEGNMSERCFDQWLELIKEILPEHNLAPNNFYSTKKLLSGMGLPVEKIDCCRNNCMLFWGEDSEDIECKHCNEPRYQQSDTSSASSSRTLVVVKKMFYFPLTPRLQRLYASKATAADMRWHASSVDDGIMRHPADSPAWKHLSQKFPSFAEESRNVRLGLSTDGFQPFGQSGQQYSSWPVIVTPYNLPPWMCMKEQYMFLTVLVPGPRNPKEKLDVFLQPLISELIQLWNVGAPTYDVSMKQNFQMRAALLWTVSDFPAYSMLSGWSTAGRLACPHCMTETDSFTLSHSAKQSWFHNHRKFLPMNHSFRRDRKNFLKNKIITAVAPQVRSGEEILFDIDMMGFVKVTEVNSETINKAAARGVGTGWKKRSIFWDLPYWKFLLIRHNLDVMHVEKNVFDNVFNTVLNVPGRTKDTSKSREELNTYCSRPALEKNVETNKYPKACYMLDTKEKKVLFEWVKTLRFPDGYVSNMGRCVDMSKLKMFGMKSHDCHVFMQRILPIGFRELLPSHVWKAITELSLFFKDLSSRNLRCEDVCRLSDNIAITLCKLERIFPPSFFDSMEYLPVHLAFEAQLAGPVQYRWMYPFERYLRKLKNNVRNKARVEGSICNAYIVEEASTFCSYYFEEHVRTRYRNVPRNLNTRDDVRFDGHPDRISVFKQPGQYFGKMTTRYLDEKEYHAAHTYVLLNCKEVTQTYLKFFVAELRALHVSEADINRQMEIQFSDWFRSYVSNPANHVVNEFLIALANGPLVTVKTYPGFYVNGYKFHTMMHGTNRASMNSGVCIKGECYGSDENGELDYYGRLLEVCELEYMGLPLKTTTLFKCEWFDPSPRGTSVHPQFKLVSINHTRRYGGYEPFVLADQAIQVYYCTYPSLRSDRKDWWEVCKIKARSKVEVPNAVEETVVNQPFQEDDLMTPTNPDIDDDTTIVHPRGGLIDIDDADEEDEEDTYLTDDEEYIICYLCNCKFVC